jgi:hypothetical protein
MARLTLSDDHLSAELTLIEGERIDAAAIYGLMASHGVTHGHIPAEIAMAANTTGPACFVVAEGTAPVPANDATIVYEFRVIKRDLAPTIGADGRADFRNLGLIESVQPGQVLARRIPPTPPLPGTTVLGRLIQPAFARDVVLRPGIGAELSEDGQTIVATIAGNPHLLNGIVTVHREIRIHGDVNLETGNIEFDGDVTVTGGVDLQMTVQATGFVSVGGSAANAKIVAGGDVHIGGGALRQARIETPGHVFARFIEHCVVNSGGSLYVEENLLHSTVQAHASVFVGGSLVGGQVHAGEKGEVRVLGARLGTPTNVRIQPLPTADEEQIESIRRERARLNEQLVSLTPRVRAAQEAYDRSPQRPQDGEALRKLLELAKLLRTRDDALAAREGASTSAPARGKPKVIVREALHPGVVVQLGEAVWRSSTLGPPCTLVGGAEHVELLPL